VTVRISKEKCYVSRQKHDIFLRSQVFRLKVGPTQLLSRTLSPGVKHPRRTASTHYNLVPRLRIIGVVPVLSHLACTQNFSFGEVDAEVIKNFCSIVITTFYKSWHKCYCHIPDFATDLIHMIIELHDSLT
jgi:hypothetical protein